MKRGLFFGVLIFFSIIVLYNEIPEVSATHNPCIDMGPLCACGDCFCPPTEICDQNAVSPTYQQCLHSAACGVTQCNDGLDNDGNGCSDWPTDPGCSSAADNTESGGVCPPPPCSGDGFSTCCNTGECVQIGEFCHLFGGGNPMNCMACTAFGSSGSWTWAGCQDISDGTCAWNYAACVNGIRQGTLNCPGLDPACNADGGQECNSLTTTTTSGCPAVAENTVAKCTDGGDNDHDGQIDCADSDCRVRSLGVSNECDTTNAAGCTVPPVAGHNGCPLNSDVPCNNPLPEFAQFQCSDGLDNDCDNLIDCLDTSGTTHCKFPSSYDNQCDNYNGWCTRTTYQTFHNSCNLTSNVACGAEGSCTDPGPGGCCYDGEDNNCNSLIDAVEGDCTGCNTPLCLLGDPCPGSTTCPDEQCLGGTLCGNANGCQACDSDDDTECCNQWICVDSLCYSDCELVGPNYHCTNSSPDLNVEFGIAQSTGRCNEPPGYVGDINCISCQAGADWIQSYPGGNQPSGAAHEHCGWVDCDAAGKEGELCVGAPGDKPNDDNTADGYYCDTNNGNICCPIGSFWNSLLSTCVQTGGCGLGTTPGDCCCDFAVDPTGWWADPDCTTAPPDACCYSGVQFGEPWYLSNPYGSY